MKFNRLPNSRFAIVLTTAFLLVAGMALTASAASTSRTQPTRHRNAIPAAVGCAYYNGDLGYRYYKADKSRGLDWWGHGTKSYNSPVVLESVSSSNALDCFHIEGGFGGSRLQYRLANSNACLNVSGRAVNARIVLYPCIYHPTSELFTAHPSLTHDGSIQIQSSYTGLCIDLSNGYHKGSILEQKGCRNADIYQAWFIAS